MGSINLDIARFETTGVYTHPNARVDIVLVHGLNGEPKRTWTAKNGVFWPTQLLPASLQDRHANVLVYGYNADVYSRSHDRSASDNFVYQHAQSLIAHLTTYRKREGSTNRPIIWVAHSLGGILVKRALLYSNDVRATNHEEYRSIYVSTYGIIFLGTPHMGSGIASWGHTLQAMSDVVVPRKLFESESVLLKTLKRDSERLQEINNHFLDIYQRFKIHMAHESHKTDLRGTKTLVVDAESASPQLPGVTYYGIEATHSGMCKFESATAPGYLTVSTAIRDWVEEAPPVIEVRWGVEDEDRRARAMHDADERRMPFMKSPPLLGEPSQPAESNNEALVASDRRPDIAPTSPLPLVPIALHTGLVSEASSRAQGDPMFLHPEPFRPNSYFVGREEELKDLHRKLTDRQRRADGTSAVLIQCLPGGGKTHLARHYVFRHRADYTGGIYWVRAKSVAEMEQFYWRIAKNEALRDSMEELTQVRSQDLCDPKQVVDIVRHWFNSFEDWLLVFDGISFDMPGIQRFIPDAKNTSLIYTSTERSVIGDYEFDNPQIIELSLLSPREAQDLLLLELDKRQPWTHDDRSRALELAQLMGRLPLMIHVAAQHLKATREPLSKYLRAYRTRPKVGSLPAYRAVWDQLKNRGANPALNLMSILVFYDQHVPVGMLSLGLSTLDSRTPIMTKDASHRTKSLNNTLRVLIAFALVERTETDNISPTSSRSSKSFDRTAEYIDILRIHSVVQAFFMETLAEEKEHHFWLERSARVFCQSFDEAEGKIREDPNVGLADDYRRFALHGRRLHEHLSRHEKRGPQYLALARKDVEDRIVGMQTAIERLSQAVQTRIITGYGQVSPVSVFDRANSLSETDSSTPSSHRSLTAGTESWVPVGDNGTEQFQSPGGYMTDDHNPYHFHVPYPQKATIPALPFQEDDDNRTEVPPSPGQTVIQSPSSDGWKEVGPRHRTIKKMERARYHDRGGAWRNQDVGDPRISVSREIAKGSVFRNVGGPRSPKARTTAASDAERTLNEIKKISPPSPQNDGRVQDKSRTSSGTLLQRPRLIAGRNSYANVLAGKSTGTEYAMSPTEFSSGLSKTTSSPSSWTAATLKKLKENIMPSRKKSADRAGPALSTVPNPGMPVPLSPQSASSPINEAALSNSSLFSSPAGPLFRGARTANSSPGHASGPFYPPGLPREVNDTSCLSRDLPAAVRQWETQVYYPGRGYLDSSDLSHGVAEDAMALSYPFVGQPHPYTINVHPPAHQPRSSMQVDGYTSEPMTRDPSAQSTEGPVSVGAGRIGSGQTAGAGSQHSSPQGATPRSLPVSHPTSIARPRRPSFVETEPSPLVADAFPDVVTSYSRWEAKWSAGRRRGGSGSIYAGSPATAHRLIRSRDPEGRSQSQSPPGRRGGRRSMPLSFYAPVGSPDVGSTNGEAMGRSGSGGIRLEDGRIIEFGQITVDVERARDRAKRQQEHRDPRAVSPDLGSEDEGVGLGIS